MPPKLVSPLKTAGDIVGTTVASVAHMCAREGLRQLDKLRASRAVGEFVVSSGLSALTTKLSSGNATVPTGGKATSPAPAEQVSVSETHQSAAPGPSSLPVEGYELLTSAQVVDLLTTVDAATAQRIFDYEMNHRRRRLVIEAAQRLISA
jgi:hypothetical protein